MKKLSEALDAMAMSSAADAAREMERKLDIAMSYSQSLKGYGDAAYKIDDARMSEMESRLAALEKAKEPEKVQCAGCHKWVDRTHFTHEMTCFDPPKPSGWRAREGHMDTSAHHGVAAIEVHPEAQRVRMHKFIDRGDAVWSECKCDRTADCYKEHSDFLQISREEP